MPVYLIAAYGFFCAVPLGLGVTLHLRFRRLMRDIEARTRSSGE